MAGQGDGEAGGSESELVPRMPIEDDLVLVCRRLNELGAAYVVVGGFAIIYGGFARTTMDIAFFSQRIHRTRRLFIAHSKFSPTKRCAS